MYGIRHPLRYMNSLTSVNRRYRKIRSVNALIRFLWPMKGKRRITNRDTRVRGFQYRLFKMSPWRRAIIDL